MTASCSYLLCDLHGSEIAKGEAEIKLEDDRFTVLPKFGQAIALSYVDVDEVRPGDFRMILRLSSKEEITIFNLGYKYDDVVSAFFQLRNEIILKYLLMNESVKRSQVWGDLVVVSPSGARQEFEKSEIRLYETSLVFLPKTGSPIRAHFAAIRESEVKDYAISIKTERSDHFIVQRMGKDLDSFSRDLSDAINALATKAQVLIKELAPSAEPSTVLALSRLLKDGRAARIREIKAVSPAVWSQFEKRLEQTFGQEYQHLRSMARQEQICLGLKRGLMGDLTGNYIWLLIPIYGVGQYGNAVAMEAARLAPAEGESAEEAGTAEAGGNATYFFRLAGREEYSALASNIDELDKRVDGMILRINDMMADINFRREPIFLSDERLANEPKFARYRYAVQNIPSLSELRQMFIGRVIHSSFDQWKSDVAELLEFNMKATDDGKWEKQ